MTYLVFYDSLLWNEIFFSSDKLFCDLLCALAYLIHLHSVFLELGVLLCSTVVFFLFSARSDSNAPQCSFSCLYRLSESPFVAWMLSLHGFNPSVFFCSHRLWKRFLSRGCPSRPNSALLFSLWFFITLFVILMYCFFQIKFPLRGFWGPSDIGCFFPSLFLYWPATHFFWKESFNLFSHFPLFFSLPFSFFNEQTYEYALYSFVF